ncbi:hypothetical protein FQN57_001616 [Myotisia sp. PD_48]|nr:hypothetical protein FQN57_001616 [Myotisia sp. PD_48]
MDPIILDYDGHPIGDSLKRPELADTDLMSKDERRAAIQQFYNSSLMVAWRMLVKKKNPGQYKAIMLKDTTIGRLFHLYRRIYELGDAFFHALSLDLYRESSKNPTTTDEGKPEFPLSFPEEKVLENENDRELIQLSTEIMRSVREELGELWPAHGLIDHDKYEELMLRISVIKEEFATKLADSDEERAIFEYFWPFDR